MSGRAVASPRVRHEWRARIAAEYGSAAITQHLTLWLMQAGAPPDLIDDGLAIVADELAHARLSHDTFVAAGGEGGPQIDQAQLELVRTGALPADILRVAVRVFCLGETVAVPLFAHLRDGCTQPIARAALDRILRDEVRHREFGWDLLDWSLAAGASSAAVTPMLPAMFGELERSYGAGNAAVAADLDGGALPRADRAWGLAPPREYAEILARTMDREYRPRFAARGIAV